MKWIKIKRQKSIFIRSYLVILLPLSFQEGLSILQFDPLGGR